MPFQLTLGISGQETSFAHPDETIYALSCALPCLSAPTAQRVGHFLKSHLQAHSPLSMEGYPLNEGRARESFTVPSAVRRTGRPRASSAFGVYALWAYCHFTGDTNAVRQLWPATKARMNELMTGDYKFDPRAKGSGRAESESLNGDIAGLVGFIRLSQRAGDLKSLEMARRRCRELLELRINLDRVNSSLLEPSRAATKSLHNAKLARYCSLVPELADALALKTEDCAQRNLRAFREARNGWYLAYGDRLIGGENYTSPLHLPSAMFAGAVGVEQLPAEQLARFVDVPWCKGDLSFIMKCVLTLWAGANRPWEKLGS